MSRVLPSEAQLAAQVDQLLGGDPVCMGRVSRATTRGIAQLLLREPEPDRDVLAERQACRALLARVCDALHQLHCLAGHAPLADISETIAMQHRRCKASLEMLDAGLHRLGQPAATSLSATTTESED